MKSDCYPISPTSTPPPSSATDSASVEKQKKQQTAAYCIGQQTEASSPESVHGPDKQQQPSALLSPSSSSGASFTEEEEHASPGHRQAKGLTSKKVNGEAKSSPKSEHHASDSESSSLNSPNQSQKTQNSKLTNGNASNHRLDEADQLHSIRLKHHLQHQRSLRNRSGEDYDPGYEQESDKSCEDEADEERSGKQNGHHPPKTPLSEADTAAEIGVDEEDKNEPLNGSDKQESGGYFLPSKRRTRDLKEENRLTDEEGRGEKQNDNESDDCDAKEAAAASAEQEKDELKDEEEELFKQQFRNHFKKRHLIVAENGSKLAREGGSNWKDDDLKADKDDASVDLTGKPSDSPVDYSAGRPNDSNLYSIYKHFYESYFTQHLNYMNGDLKSEPKGDHQSEEAPAGEKSEALKNGDLNVIDLKKRNELDHFDAARRPNGGEHPANGAPFETPNAHALGSDSVLTSDLENKYSAANLANHETLATLDDLQGGSRLKNMLYTHKLPESMDTIANYLNYYNGGVLTGSAASNGFGKTPSSAEFDSYRKHYGSLVGGQIKDSLDSGVKGESSKSTGNALLSNALNPGNLSINKLMIPPDGQLLSKSLSRSLNGERLLTNGSLLTGSTNLNSGSLHSSPTSSLFSQASPPINFLNYPRPPGQAMKPNSYHQFLCNLHQQQNTKVAVANDLSISNLSNTAAVGGALNNSRRKFRSLYFKPFSNRSKGFELRSLLILSMSIGHKLDLCFDLRKFGALGDMFSGQIRSSTALNFAR